MKLTSIITTLAVILAIGLDAQVLVSPTPVPADGDAMVKVEGTTGGFTMPRMTRAQRLAIANPAVGLSVYQTDDKAGYYVFNDPGWTYISTPRKEHGKVKIDMNLDTYSGIIGTGFTAAQVGGAGSNEVAVTFTQPFPTAPNVIVSSEPFPPLPTITGPANYCSPCHNNNCVATFAADYIDDVFLESHPGGSPAPVAAFSISNPGTNCDNTPCNYVDHWNTPAFQATVYGPCVATGGQPGSFFDLGMRSSVEWRDDLFIYIDWNHDADFFDADEVVMEKYLGPGDPADLLWWEYNLTTSPDAKNGLTVMRCMSMWAATTPEACGTHTWGETEDYQVQVIGGCGAATADDRASNCSINTISNTGFRVSCSTIVGVPKPASFSFYVSE